MSMNTALSGLNAAQTDIATTSNNIANVGTVGFRGSRAEFADIFNTSPYSVSATTTGSGVEVTRIAQDFSQGSIVNTGNQLDLAIRGVGFFAMQQPANQMTGVGNETVFSRAGAFDMGADGTVVNSSGQALLAWPVSSDGQPLSQDLSAAQPLKVPLSMGTPVATSSIDLELTLPTDPAMTGGQTAVPPTAAFDPEDLTTWAHRTAVPVFDDTGRAVDAELYIVRSANPSVASPETQYEFHLVRDGLELTPDAGFQLSFGANGLPVASSQPMAFTGTAGTITLDLSSSSLADKPFEVASAQQNGRQPTTLTTLEVDSKGTVLATYGAMDSIAIGKVMLVSFSNPGGLRQVGNASFLATSDSGNPVGGPPGSGGFGLLRAGALEQANVDLTEELVDLITAQRNYQASAKAMETSSAMMQTILTMRS